MSMGEYSESFLYRAMFLGRRTTQRSFQRRTPPLEDRYRRYPCQTTLSGSCSTLNPLIWLTFRAPTIIRVSGGWTARGSSGIETLDSRRALVMSVSDMSECDASSFPEYSIVCEGLLAAVRPRALVRGVRGIGSLGSGELEPTLSSCNRLCSLCSCIARSKPPYDPVTVPPGLARSISSSSSSIRASVRMRSTHSSASFLDLASRW